MEFQKLVKKIVIVCCFVYFIYQVITQLSKSKNGNIEFINEEIVTMKSDRNTLNKRLPDALIIGIMKAGTTMLLKYILTHPDVKGIETEELNFFTTKFNKGLNWYINKMKPAREGEIVMEKSIYFHHKMASQRIWKTFGKNIKLILIVKDPVERLLSHYALLTGYHLIQQEFSKLAFTNENGTLAVNAIWQPVEIGNYADQMKIWLSSGFDLSDFLIIDGHKFAQDPWPELSFSFIQT